MGDGMDNYKRNWNLTTDRTRLIVTALTGFLLVVGWFIFSAKNVTVIVNGEPRHLTVRCRTVGDVVHQAGVDLKVGDVVRPGKNSRVYDGSVIVVAARRTVEIIDGREKRAAPMTLPSVAAILASQGITLGKDDLVEAQLNPKQGKLPRISITRRSINTFKERKVISYSVKREPDDTLAPWENRIVRKGVTGILENTVRVIIENGREKERKIVATKTLREPVNELVRYSVATVSRGNSTYRSVRELTMQATAYTHTGSRTATGTWPAYGTVAVDPRTIPLGTPLYVEGYGFAVAADTGGAIKGRRLDVFQENRKNALRWGKKTVKVRILRKVN